MPPWAADRHGQEAAQQEAWRHCVADFRAMGILRKRLVNYLGTMAEASTGVHDAPGTGSDMSIESYAGSDSLFDTEKLVWLNATTYGTSGLQATRRARARA